MTPTAVRDHLRQVRDDLREKRAQRAERKKERDAAQKAFGEAHHDGPITEWPEFTAAEEATRQVGELDDQIADLTLAENRILEMLGEEADDSGSSGGNPSLQPAAGARSWDGHALLAGNEVYEQARRQHLFTSRNQFGTIQLGAIASREDAMRLLSPLAAAGDLPAAPAGVADTAGASPGAYGGLIAPDRRGLLAPLLRPLRLLDLFPTGTTDSNTIEYVSVSAIPASAAPVAEGALKPQEGLTLIDNTAPVRTIAGWIKVNRQAMDDAAALGTLINTLLPYDVRRQIEFQILRGDGTGQNIKGILNTTGVGNPAAVAGDNAADRVLRAMTTVILSNAEPNFAAMHPLDWQDLLLMREDTAGVGTRTGTYLFGGPGTMAAATIWGLAITPSTALNQNQSLVGDAMGATILFREAVNVKTSDSDQDDFVRNRVTVLAEARVAFPVWRPSNFAIADPT